MAEQIKVLFITQDFSKSIERNTFYMQNALARLVDLEVWYEPGNIHDILDQIRFKPDFILLNDMKFTRCPEITGLSTLKIPFGVFMHDLFYKPTVRMKYLEENNVKHIFTHYRDLFYRLFPNYIHCMRWLPHWINSDILKDYGEAKDIDWLLMGNVCKSFYPLRLKILQTMKKNSGFVYHPHPGYRDIDDNEEHVFVGEKYAREINRAKMFLTCDSIYHVPFIKYYEVLACNTLLLAPDSKELRDLGFIPGKNFISIDEENFLRKAQYHQKHYKQIGKQIAEEGFKMVHQNHTVSIRAAQLVDMIKDILENGTEQ